MINAIHLSSRVCAPLPLRRELPGVWSSITKIDTYFFQKNISWHNLFAGKVGNGQNIRLWIDVWSGGTPLKDQFPDIFKMEKEKNRNIASIFPVLFSGTDFLWSWSKNTFSNVEQHQISRLSTILGNTLVTDLEDAWTWTGTRSNNFAVKEVRKLITQSRFGPHPRPFPWTKWAPIKVNVWGWRALMNRLPTKVELQKRSVSTGNLACIFCGEQDETLAHILTACPLAIAVWDLVSSWCKIPNLFAFDVQDLLYSFFHTREAKYKINHFIILTTSWFIWKARNEKIFRSTEAIPRRILEQIKHNSFTWIVTRSKIKNITWESWVDFEF